MVKQLSIYALKKQFLLSTNSYHNLSMGGTDNLKTSIAHNWQQGPINSPTVLKSSLNVAQFWGGRAADLKEQAGGPIANPGEMAFTHTLAIDVLSSISEYVIEFKQVFGSDEVTIDGVNQAIAEFEETLVTPNSPFDQWLLGDENAQIVAFMKTLPGDQPSFILPYLPPSTDKTPAPTPFEYIEKLLSCSVDQIRFDTTCYNVRAFLPHK